MKLVVIGLTLSSSWGNGHATTYRALLAALAERGHDILFLERDQPWYAAARDLPRPEFCRLALYDHARDLASFAGEIAAADLVIIGSYVTQGAEIARSLRRRARVLAFYDIDTPVTLAALAEGTCTYLDPGTIPLFDIYFSFTGGPTLRLLETRHGARRALPLYCAVDPALYRPAPVPPRWHLGYLGTYSPDRQEMLETLLIKPARRMPGHRFVVAGPQYPAAIAWPANVTRIEHLPPAEHAAFYNSLLCTLNVTRRDMVEAGFSPSVRLFEAAACATPIISDPWPGLDAFFRPGVEIFTATSAEAVIGILDRDAGALRRVGQAGRRAVLAGHTARHRALALEAALGNTSHASGPGAPPRPAARVAESVADIP